MERNKGRNSGEPTGHLPHQHDPVTGGFGVGVLGAAASGVQGSLLVVALLSPC